MTDHLHAAGQNQEDFQIESEEKPSNEAAEAAAHSPVVGEKRLRDKDDFEHRREAPSDGGGTPGFKSESSPDAHLHVPLCCPTLSFHSGRLMRIRCKSRSA